MTNYRSTPGRLTPHLIHVTKNTEAKDEYSAYENIVNILKAGEIWGNGNKALVKGGKKATCFMDVPYGIIIKKSIAYNKGCQPVLYSLILR